MTTGETSEAGATAAPLTRSAEDQLAALLSHDMREPIRRITEFSQFLQEDFANVLGQTGNQFLNEISGAAQDLTRLLDDMREYKALDYYPARDLPVSLEQVARTALQLCEPLIVVAGARCTITDLPRVTADADLLELMFNKLIRNALMYRHPDRPTEMSIDHEVINGETLINIRDNGIGFDPRFKARLTEPLARLHSDKAHYGSGLGLAVCQKICERYDWILSADSQPGIETVFVINLGRSAQG